MSFCPAKGDLYTHVERCRTRFFELREEFNYIHSAHLRLPVKVATLMGRLADRIVLIVEANQEKRGAVRRAKEQLENSQVQLLGDVLDQGIFSISVRPEVEREPRWARRLPVRDYQGFGRDSVLRRFSVRPGITCLWQINGRSSVSLREWMELDLDSINHWSFWLDLKVIAKTIQVVLKRVGAA